MPRKCVQGVNDLLTRFPSIAAQADGWDPSLYAAFSHWRMPWLCEKGHSWTARIQDRTSKNNGCPCCGGWAVIEGENDLQTLFPEIAKEAYGWNPSKVKYGSYKKMRWMCQEGHVFESTINNRTNGGRSCPYCATYGYRPSRPAWMYLMEREDDQQIGITNSPKTRLATHKKSGWALVEILGPSDGAQVLRAETAIKKWLKDKRLQIEGTRENWKKTDLVIASLAEIALLAGLGKWDQLWGKMGRP